MFLAAQAGELQEVWYVLRQMYCTSQAMTLVVAELLVLSADLADLADLTDLI